MNEDIKAPDFENEITVLSARPVVPLAQIALKSRSGLWFAGTTAAFLLIALGVGVFIQFRRAGLSPAQDPITDSSATLPPGVTEMPGAEEAPQVRSNNPEPSDNQNNRAKPAAKKKNADPLEEEVSAPKAARQEVERSYENYPDDQTPRRLRREARRLRREAERASERNPADLDGIFRIEDIFGGPRRPSQNVTRRPVLPF
jgi:hypothetical protein